MFDPNTCELCDCTATDSNPVLNIEELEIEPWVPERLDGYVYVCAKCADVSECECGATVANEHWDDHDCYWMAGEAHHAMRVEQEYM